MQTPNTPLKRGWTVHIDGEGWDDLKIIQGRSKLGTPSYTSIIGEALRLLKKETRPSK